MRNTLFDLSLATEATRTIYLGAAEVAEGYAGATLWVHLAEEPNGHIHAVHPWGFHTWADPEKGVGSPTVLEFRPAPSIEDLTGQPARFDTGHAYVNGVVVKDHGDGTVDCSVNAKSHTVYRYPLADVRISTTNQED